MKKIVPAILAVIVIVGGVIWYTGSNAGLHNDNPNGDAMSIQGTDDVNADNTDAGSTFTGVLDPMTGASNEMNTAEFWIARTDNPDEILMDAKEIEAFNKALANQYKNEKDKSYYDLTDKNAWFYSKMTAEEVSKLIDTNIGYVKDNGDVYVKGNKLGQAKLQAYFDDAKPYAGEDAIFNVSGVAVKQSNITDLPTSDIFTASDLDEYYPILQQTYLHMNDRVVVLCESSDREWYYVLNRDYCGWTAKENIALFVNVEEAFDYFSQPFYTVCSDSATLEGSNQQLYMGSRLYGEGGEVSLPMRGKDGYVVMSGPYSVNVTGKDEFATGITDGTATDTANGTDVGTTTGIVEGCLDFTRRNILTLAFSELGEPYGWGGRDGERDCSSYLQDIYRCFGLELCRNSKQQMAAPGTVELAGADGADYNDRIAELEAGDYVGFRGHMMLYLGQAEGKHYVVSQLATYVPENVSADFAQHVESPRKCQVNSLDVHRGNGNTWAAELLAKMHW